MRKPKRRVPLDKEDVSPKFDLRLGQGVSWTYTYTRFPEKLK